ncbi:MAG: 2Fe-2S iron-sulfur cluster-binding protein [Solirubrobacterales bacterium]
MNRLPQQPGERIDRARVVSFEFDGKPFEGLEGDTIGSALYAAGQRTFSRSFKYHRRRGLLCCAGQCPNCLVAVDGAPGVRACTEPVREGMRVEHMNASPSLEFDLMRATDLFGGPFTPPGFYYKTFIRPRRLWPLYEKVLRRAAGLGRLSKVAREEREWRTEYRRRHCDVLVVGAGEAGLTAAIEAAEGGADVVLCDEGPEPGGWLLVTDPVRAHALGEQARAAGVEILTNAPALGYFDGLVPVWQGDTLHQIRAQRHVFATGSIEQPALFAGNDLPGVMLSGAVRRLISLYGIKPGMRAVVAADDETAQALKEAGVEVIRADAILKAKGRGKVQKVVIEHQGERKRVGADLLVVSAGFVPANSLVRQAGANAEVIGDAARSQASGTSHQAPESRNGKCFACLCEDVTAKDIHTSVSEGYDSLELTKRYTTVTMGPCQGRMCHAAAASLLAQETGQSLHEIGSTTARPPWQAVPLGAFAGRPFEPAKRTPIHARQCEQGAHVLWAGDWRRAYDYGDPAGEALAVHESGGLIDVSTLGKLLVRGPQAGEFLDRLYPNRFSNLKPGRVRYGVLTTDAGRITDDGTVCRLDDESFYVTTTSSGAGAVEQWFAWWLADWRMDVTLTDLTQGLAAVNVAGPRAREIMEQLTELDVSNEAFPYLDGQRGQVAGVPSLILRIGFVGELGYEIHFSSAYGEHVWDRVLELGARPFGLEPQRILRLQKMHILVGQDTDSESNPFGAAMPWIVKLDKDEDFIGKWALEHYAEIEPETALVGFTMANGHVPTEGAVVIRSGVPAGQVTSSRFSPQVGKVIGLAWVPRDLAADDARIEISDNGATYAATVQTKPFYDPDGEVLRS